MKKCVWSYTVFASLLVALPCVPQAQAGVHSDQVAAPAAVRYAWHDDAAPNLANKEGLPASPFRTDAWKGVTE
jgi:hypothetical protein